MLALQYVCPQYAQVQRTNTLVSGGLAVEQQLAGERPGRQFPARQVSYEMAAALKEVRGDCLTENT